MNRKSLALAVAATCIAATPGVAQTAPGAEPSKDDIIIVLRRQRERAEDQELKTVLELTNAQRELAKAKELIEALKKAVY